MKPSSVPVVAAAAAARVDIHIHPAFRYNLLIFLTHFPPLCVRQKHSDTAVERHDGNDMMMAGWQWQWRRMVISIRVRVRARWPQNHNRWMRNWISQRGGVHSEESCALLVLLPHLTPALLPCRLVFCVFTSASGCQHICECNTPQTLHYININNYYKSAISPPPHNQTIILQIS